MVQAKYAEAYKKIKSMLIDGSLAPGSFISEDYLQEKTDSGRTPVREAIQKLSAERFFEIFPRQGIKVTEISFNLLSEIYDFREMIEPNIARKSCDIISTSILEELRFKFLSPPADFEEKRVYLINLDTLLHTSILECCSNRFLTDTMKIVLDHDARIKHFSYQEQQNDAVSIPEHIEIIDSFLERDPSKVYNSTLNHIITSRQQVVSSLMDHIMLQ